MMKRFMTRRFMMGRLGKSLHRGQKGFTLIELLIVIAILGVLAAVVIPNFTSFIGQGETEAQAVEHRTVQTAMVAVLAANEVSAVAAHAATNDLSALPTGAGISADKDFDNYLHDTNTAYWYAWNEAGEVTQTTTAP